MGVAVMATVLGASRVLDRFARQAISIQSERDDLYSQMRSSQQLIQKLELRRQDSCQDTSSAGSEGRS